jgi:uncharacterized protein YbjT (DUF2867 family)
MRVAVAGAGDLGRYVVEELLSASHEVVILSRTRKPWCEGQNITFHATSYSIPSILSAIADCDALISTILDYSLHSATVHLALLEACKQSEKCKRYIPSEYGGNVGDFPDQPTFYAANHNPVREQLRGQNEVMWTLFNCGWLTDYFIPANKRYIKDIGGYHPVDLSTGSFIIPGNGEDPITFTAARDVAKALARLISCDEWEEVTYVSGDSATWNHIADLLEERGVVLSRSYVPRDVLEKQVARAESEEKVLIAQYSLFSISGAALLPEGAVKQQAQKYFDGVEVRSVSKFLDDAVRMIGDVAV